MRAEMNKPNILLISADQMRADAMGCAGNPVITPNIDQLAAEGTLFERAYCVNPVCTPSRVAIFTGRYPHCTGAWSIGVSLNEEEITLCDHLKPLGYRCVANGKMHFRPELNERDSHPGASPAPVRFRNRPSDGTYYGFDEHHLTEDHPEGEYLEWLQHVAPEQDLNGDHGNESLHEKGGMLPPELHQTRWIADRSIETIRSHDSAFPLFLWTSFVDPHHPFNAPHAYVEKYRNVSVADPVKRPGELELRPDHLRHQGERGYWPGGGEEHQYTDEQVRHIIRNYYAMITFIDEQIGRIRAALLDRGMLENTIVIFTSDHGELLGDHGLMMKGPWHYEGAIRVPMIFRGPAIAKGIRTQALMENADILPTLLQLIGEKVPYGVQGLSQAPVLEGKSAGERDSIVCSYDAHDRGIHLKTLCSGRFKLNVFADESYGELFDLREDPCELHNRFFDSAFAPERARLFEMLASRMIQDEDPLPERKALY
jgi:arylsulfatase